MIDKSTLLDTPEARAEAYDKIAEYGGTMSDVQVVHEMSGIDEGIRKYRATLEGRRHAAGQSTCDDCSTKLELWDPCQSQVHV